MRTTPINFQPPKSIVWKIPLNWQRPKSIGWAISISEPAPEINYLNNSNLLTVSEIKLFVQFQFMDNTRNILLTQFQSTDGLRNPFSEQFQSMDNPKNKKSHESIVWTISINRQPPKSIAWTVPHNRQPSQSVADPIANKNRNCAGCVNVHLVDSVVTCFNAWIVPRTCPTRFVVDTTVNSKEEEWRPKCGAPRRGYERSKINIFLLLPGSPKLCHFFRGDLRRLKSWHFVCNRFFRICGLISPWEEGEEVTREEMS